MKRFLAFVVLAVALVVVLAACNSRDSDLVGTWDWQANDSFYTFNSDGSGTALGGMFSINWSTSGNVLSICDTPAACGNRCPAPAEWTYSVNGNRLTLTARNLQTGVAIGDTFQYTRR